MLIIYVNLNKKIGIHSFILILTDVKIPSYCKGAIGLKDVDIIWRPLAQRNSSSWAVYRISYCPLFPSCTQNEQYQLGCILNTTQHQLQKELQCRMTEESLFPKMFFYIVELQNLSGVFISQRLICRLLTRGMVERETP